jgi:outer membrane protein assembly factor BamB
VRPRGYVSFFGGRRHRRGDGLSGGSRRRWPLFLLVGLAGVSLWYLLAFRSDSALPDPDATETPPSVLRPILTTTTIGSEAVVDDVACPSTGVPWTAFQASPERTGCIEAPVIENPEILWITDVGVQGWLNNPVIADGSVYVGSAGASQLEGDGDDGVYALDLETGEQLWFFPATMDVNGVALSGNVVVATGDEGQVWGIDAATGGQVWSEDLGAAVFGNPLVIDGLVVVGDSRGDVVAFDAATGARRWVQRVTGAIRGGAASDGTRIYVASEQRDVIAVDLNGNQIWRTTVDVRTTGATNPQIFAAPTVVGDLVVLSTMPNEVSPEPALMALDASTGTLVWRASDTAAIKTEWANVRSSPAVIGDLLVYGEGYSGSLVGIAVADGHTQWAIEVGPYCSTHWPSPAVVSGQVILARQDGAVYGVDLRNGRVAWSLYLGEGDAAGSFPATFTQTGFCDAAIGHAVQSSPAVADTGVIVIGTLEGLLYAIGDIGG